MDWLLKIVYVGLLTARILFLRHNVKKKTEQPSESLELLCPSSGILNTRKQYLEYQTMDRVHKPSDFECYTPP
jgi:hypothetical protein